MGKQTDDILSLESLMPFGKHIGEQLEDVIEDDPEYVTWLFIEEVVEFDDVAIQRLEDKKII